MLLFLLPRIHESYWAGYASSISGGLTTSLILPGSADAIGMCRPLSMAELCSSSSPGGQAFVIKLRPTGERSPTSMLVEPPYNLNSSHIDNEQPLRWRHMK